MIVKWATGKQIPYNCSSQGTKLCGITHMGTLRFKLHTHLDIRGDGPNQKLQKWTHFFKIQLSILFYWIVSWDRIMEKFFALLALCVENSPATGGFPAQRPVTRNFDVPYDLCLNKWVSKQSWGWWFETRSRSLWCHCNVNQRNVFWKVAGKYMLAFSLIQWHMIIMCMFTISTIHGIYLFKVSHFGYDMRVSLPAL